MDLTDKAVRRETIVRLFSEELGIPTLIGLALTPLLSPLYEPGDTWPENELSDVDEAQLRVAIGSVAQSVRANLFPRLSIPLSNLTGAGRPALDAAALSTAMKGSQCHYLWFC